MTLRASFIWKNPDATRDLNDRLRRIVHRGIVWGGALNPAPSGLNVIVDPAVAVSFDGMTVVEDSQATLPVSAGQTQYVVLWAKYNEGGVPATPTLTYQVLEQSVYNAHPEKDYMIVYGVVTLAPAAVSVTVNDIDLTNRDEVDPLGRNWFRGKVANPAALPTGAPEANRIGDFYFVDSDNTFFFWNGTIWEPLNTGSYNSETTLMNKLIADSERDRIKNGSGVIGGPRPPQSPYAAEPDLVFEQTPSIADQIGVDTFSALVNGHYMEVHGQYVTLDPKPGVGTRYDLVFLEVWREDISAPETWTYDRNPDGTLTYTIGEISDKVEELQWKAGIPVAPTADNFDVNTFESDNHDWRVVKYRLGFKTDMGSTVGLYNPSDATMVAAILNHDGNAFSAQPAGAGSDDRVWIGASTIASDGYSWAIPLFVVKRLSTENPGGGDGIKLFRDGVRHVFPVYPVCDLDQATRGLMDKIHATEEAPVGIDHYPHDEPSGWLEGYDTIIQTVGAANSIRVADETFKVRMRGIEDRIRVPGGVDIQLGTPPAASHERIMVYLKLNITLYDNELGSAVTDYYRSLKHRPLIPSGIAGTMRGQGWKKGFVQWQFVFRSIGSTAYTDEDEIMPLDGWTKGDVTLPPSLQYEDGGLWSRAIAIDADDRIHPFLAEWAIPVCLIHRRNTSPWDFNTNPNGTGVSRPDTRTDATLIHQDDLVDLRRRADLDTEELPALIDHTMDLAMRGQLRTRMANKYQGAGTGGTVGGARILQTDSLGTVAGAFNLTPPDSIRKIWSDAKELHLVGVEFDLFASSSGDLYDYTYEPGPGPGLPRGVLQIHSSAIPNQYFQIVRHIPAALYAERADNDFYGPPLWSTREEADERSIDFSPAAAKYIDGSNAVYTIPFLYKADNTQPGFYLDGQGFEVTAMDSTGRAITMEGHINLGAHPGGVSAPATAVLSWWVHYDRSFTGSPYSANYGLAEIPDVVHSVRKDPSGTNEEMHLGPMYTVVRKSIAAASSVTITAADVTASSGVSGTVTMVGIDKMSTRSNYGSDVTTIISSMTMAAARNAITVNFSGGPHTFDAEFVIFFETADVNKWVEIGKGGKSVQAYFEWEENEIDFGAPPGAGVAAAYSIGSATWRNLTVGGKTYLNMPCVWTRPDPVSDYTWLDTGLGGAGGGGIRGYQNSNLMSIITTAATDTRLLVIAPAHKPLTSAAADQVVIHYTYTPYQGLMSDGGKTPVLPGALTKAKKMLHGQVENNSEFFVSQSGACSYYSGVDGWSGQPVNHSPLSLVSVPGFEEYNVTDLVKPQHPLGTVELNERAGEGRGLAPAAILRLPFPQRSQMFDSISSNYHTGVMDFDIDPSRAGVASGHLSYAPGYEPSYVAFVDLRRYHHFINGLTPLAAHGEPKKLDETSVIAPSSYKETTGNPTLFLEYWSLAAINNASYWINPVTRGGEIVKRIRTNADISSFFPTSGSGIFLLSLGGSALVSTPAGYLDMNNKKPRYTSKIPINSGTAIEDMAFFMHPGSVITHELVRLGGVYDRLAVEYHLNYVEQHSTGLMWNTSVVSDSEYFYNNAQLLLGSTWNTQRSVDLIKLPFSSSCSRKTFSEYGTTASYTQGNEITYASSMTSLEGLRVGYPPSWSPSTISTLESYISAPDNGMGAGRGLFFGTNTYRFSMPVLVPGSGTALSNALLTVFDLIDQETEPPVSVPYMPGEPLFATSNQVYLHRDHGGPVAYVCYGTAMRPEDPDYRNQAVLQISGGPTGGTSMNLFYAGANYSDYYTAADLHGTALDAFWMPHRPVLKSRR